jgi:uncharacterized surface protein with fasciclin (FAS1) repeats
MKAMPIRILGATLALTVVGVTACSSDDSSTETSDTRAPASTTTAPMSDSETSEATDDIVAVAVDNGSFETLTTLLTEAGLVETLQGEGPFTVFAPTDEAFAKVPPETLAAVRADPELLREVLTYHVLSGAVPSSEVASGTVDTVAGQPLEIVVSGGKVMVGDATVVTADVMASNGVIHVIDTVLIPPSASAS